MSKKEPLTEERQEELVCYFIMGILVVGFGAYVGFCFLDGIGAWFK